MTDLTDCPKIDKELKECEEASIQEDYYGESERDLCYFELALDRENITLCRKVRNTYSYADYTAAKCGAELAMYLDDPTLCDELTISSKYGCYAELAEELEDYTMCEYIKSKGKRDECLDNYVYYNAYYIDDWSICDLFSEGSSEADSCYYDAATQTGDESYCDEIEGGGYYAYYSVPSCYAGVAKDVRKPSLCEKLTDSSDVDDCYYDYATSYPYDVDVCDNIEDEYYKEDCIDWANYSSDYYW